VLLWAKILSQYIVVHGQVAQRCLGTVMVRSGGWFCVYPFTLKGRLGLQCDTKMLEGLGGLCLGPLRPETLTVH